MNERELEVRKRLKREAKFSMTLMWGAGIVSAVGASGTIYKFGEYLQTTANAQYGDNKYLLANAAMFAASGIIAAIGSMHASREAVAINTVLECHELQQAAQQLITEPQPSEQSGQPLA